MFHLSLLERQEEQTCAGAVQLSFICELVLSQTHNQV
jgi:hypothetical protein